MENMKSRRTIYIVIAVAVLLLLIGAVIISNAMSNEEISETKAIEIALSDSKLKQNEVEHLICNIEHDDGLKYYEVQFQHENNEYEYDINASNGKIVDYSKEKIDSVQTNDTNPAKDNYIGEEKAMQIAYEDAGIKDASKLSHVKINLDTGDNLVYYDIEFRSDKHKYNYDIDAISGDIIEKEIDKK
ncbi:MAG: PepSY domain-containing protein [Firmicutes bacterium]|nr:PepSY domain-containing protein [Bacillota bacterium]